MFCFLIYISFYCVVFNLFYFFWQWLIVYCNCPVCKWACFAAMGNIFLYWIVILVLYIQTALYYSASFCEGIVCGSVSGNDYVGGILGRNGGTGTRLENCYMKGSVTASASNERDKLCYIKPFSTLSQPYKTNWQWLIVYCNCPVCKWACFAQIGYIYV